MTPEYPEFISMFFMVLLPGFLVPASLWVLLVALAVRGMKNL